MNDGVFLEDVLVLKGFSGHKFIECAEPLRFGTDLETYNWL